jgi:hypothetical protein
MPSPEDPIIAAALVAAIIVVSIVFFAFVRRSARRRLEKLAPAFELGTSRAAGLLSAAVEGLYQGFTCRYTIIPPSQHNPGGASLRLKASSPLQWSAAIEDFGSRLMARFGIVKDVDIGDAEMDGRLRFSSGDEIALVGMLGQQRTRDAMRRLSALDNFNSITVRADRVDIRWSPRSAQLDEDPEALRLRLTAAVELVTACGMSPTIG